MTTRMKAYLAAILFSAIIGLSFLFVKIALNWSNPIDILAHRFTFAFLFAALPVLLGKIKINITKQNVISIFPLAVLHPTLFFSLQVFGLVYISSSEAGILQATIPIFTLLLATIFLKEKSTGWQIVSIFLSVAGIMYIFIMNDVHVEVSSYKGALLILFSALSFAGYNVLARKLTKEFTLYTLTFLMTLFGFITFNIISFTNHLLANSFSSYFTPLASISYLGSIFYLGVLATVCTVFLSNYALSKIEASKMSVFTNFSTLITIIAGVIFLNETFRYYHVIGTIVILAGVIGTNYFGRKPTQKNEKEIELNKEKELEEAN